MFSARDLEYLESCGISTLEAEHQLWQLQNGVPAPKLLRPCQVGDGVLRLSEALTKQLVQKFQTQAPTKNILKFVPASGAASRMFRDFWDLLEDLKPFENDPKSWSKIIRPAESALDENRDSFENQLRQKIYRFIDALPRLPFWENLQKVWSDQLHGEKIDFKIFSDWTQNSPLSLITLLGLLLHHPQLDWVYGPKALLPFHRSPQGAYTAFEEQLREAQHYLSSQDKKIHVHFTIAPDQWTAFENQRLIFLAAIGSQQRLWEINFSIQDPSTDTIAFELDGQVSRDAQGLPRLRPGGHGSLLQNLEALDQADLIFIKNIDNVAVDSCKPQAVYYQKVLSGLLMDLEEKIFQALHDLEDSDPAALEDAHRLAKNQLELTFPEDFETWNFDRKKAVLFSSLNRPIRVCGVISSTRESGGGPFWVEDRHGLPSRQIIESAQVDWDKIEARKVFEAAPYFNPVQMVLSRKDFRGQPFQLEDFADFQASFISIRHEDGKAIKILEHPGLWNGSMADWITIFVELPTETFAPVKTVWDFLRKEHQA